MALFTSKKKISTKKESVETSVVSATRVSRDSRNLSSVIKRPHITEKASLKSESGVYTFEVSTDSTKKTVAAAVKELYNVSPIKVTVVAIPSKNAFVRGKWGVKKGGKKAYVFLKKGETIEFV